MILSLHEVLGPPRDACPRDAFARDVKRVGDVHVSLSRTAGTIAGVVTVGDELHVGVEDRIGAKAGGEYVGLGLRELEGETPELKVVGHEALEGLIQGETVGGAFVFGGRREGERAVDGERAGGEAQGAAIPRDTGRPIMPGAMPVEG